VKFEQQSVTNS